MVQLFGIGCLSADAVGKTRDEIRIVGQDTVGCGIGQIGQRNASRAAVVIRAENQDEIRLQDGGRGLTPHMRIDRAAALVIDVGRDDPATPPFDVAVSFDSISILMKKGVQLAYRSGIAEIGQRRWAVGLRSKGIQSDGSLSLKSIVLEQVRAIQFGDGFGNDREWHLGADPGGEIGVYLFRRSRAVTQLEHARQRLGKDQLSIAQFPGIAEQPHALALMENRLKIEGA